MNSFHSKIILLASVFIIGTYSVSAQQNKELTVFAAASLTEVFRKIGTQFESVHPDVKVVFNVGGSQQLAQQILEGARADVFASANAKQISALARAGVIDSATVIPFAQNRLVIIVPEDNPARIESPRDIGRIGTKVAIGDKAVPVGQYSYEFLEKASKLRSYSYHFKTDVLNNVISFEENVKAVVGKVMLGECDAGIVYRSDVSQDSLHKVRVITIPEKLNVVAEYPIGIIKVTSYPDEARMFIDFVRSQEGQEILSHYGFQPVRSGSMTKKQIETRR